MDLCHFLIHSNHVHFIFVVIDPTDACKFMGYFKAEVAHRLNILMGFDKRTVWCEGYDSPVLLDPVRALIAVSYLYANPAKDYQEDSIDNFPGLSSWNMFLNEEYIDNWHYLSRTKFRELPDKMHNLAGYSREAHRILESSKDTIQIEIKPNSLLKSLGIKTELEQKLWREKLIKRVRTLEERFENKRIRENKKVIGRENILKMRLTLNYNPKRNGKRMWCLAEKKRDRIEFIERLKSLIKIAKEVFKNWHLGDYSMKFPCGLFPPGMPKLTEPVCVFS